MARLVIQQGCYTEAGRKSVNQDALGAHIPSKGRETLKGAAFVIADGISSSDVSQQASAFAVEQFLKDYFDTSDAWSVATSGQRVLKSINANLYARTLNSQGSYDKNKGHVCTFSALICKGTQAHLFHAGDTRIYQFREGQLTCLTQDHRIWLSETQSHLSRAFGVDRNVEIDQLVIPMQEGDLYLLCSDGVYEFADLEAFAVRAMSKPDELQGLSEAVIAEALEKGSKDNLSVQAVYIKALPEPGADEFLLSLQDLKLPDLLEVDDLIDQYRICRKAYSSPRSHVYLAEDIETGEQVALKIPSMDLRGDSAYLERLLLEEWIVRRIDNPFVIAPPESDYKKTSLYTLTEWLEGDTLAQYLIDHPNLPLSQVRRFAEQIAKGLQAFHRLEMIHQDLRPENIMVDKNGNLKIIDFGSTSVAGISEYYPPMAEEGILGTALYSAPEYFLGEGGSEQSDLFSLAVLVYFMLSGDYPYGTKVAACRTHKQQIGLLYQPIVNEARPVPAWMNLTLKKALSVNPMHRQEAISEFIYDLSHPSDASKISSSALIDQHPVKFWQGVSFVLAIALVVSWVV